MSWKFWERKNKKEVKPLFINKIETEKYVFLIERISNDTRLEKKDVIHMFAIITELCGEFFDQNDIEYLKKNLDSMLKIKNDFE